ncbi:DUF1836 domain-containing protein [Clostridium botulinum]|uniref:DUF1836 domain-containing protein n=1 Tax=Clostridium botulinum (strain Eklund 17B / Type B) TaxID=935198 RepID=B2THF9_CLOBB|nr:MULTISPECIES: DUF1836 domain-containing protein [Clostridium]ACD22599.1 conserved hypothetical protein [Clostridium botulinum B str. Eklund 17B (NRP)]MBN1043798.1 DUF1836 domain-containing protein [Clostridium botulinum]MBY6977406.1 DUF1836 domain-containing protein [Clostridium botulinum]MBY7001961.1 DUF1836 domain-containing protein [Clostridium botulinum]MCR1275592.1 DUF1836 domain-containing protein [Clostridium botulinum]
MTKDILNIMENLNLDKKINLEDIPEIDLYMDQVIQLFENKLSVLKRKEEDKVLTKTMINNYAKAKLLMSIKNKKYSKEHLILMSLIYDLKGALSINDIKLTLDNIVKKYENNEEYDLRALYKTYLDMNSQDVNEFKEYMNDKEENVKNLLSENNINGDFEEKFLLVGSMISMSNMYRRMGETLIDEYFMGDEK